MLRNAKLNYAVPCISFDSTCMVCKSETVTKRFQFYPKDTLPV